MVDLIQSESICQIDLIRIGSIWIGVAASEKSYAPRLGQISAPLYLFQGVRVESLEFVWIWLIDSQFQPI
jgi:hypothetical protein